MKKLLVFTSTFPRWKNDTIPLFVYELSKRLTKNFKVHVLAPNYPGAKEEEIMDKMRIHRFRYFFRRYETLTGSGGILPTIKKNKLNYFKVPFFLIGEYFALKKAVKEIKPDIIHAHWIIPQGWIASLINKKSKVEYIVTSHGSDILGLKGFIYIKKQALENAKKITVVSTYLKREIIKNINASLKNKMEVIPMGVDTKLFNPKKRDVLIKKKYNMNGPFLLFVGRLAPEKGIDLLIEAMPKIIENNPKSKLMIIGDGILKEKIMQRIKELKIKDNIILTGWIQNKDLPKYYATADVFICPSRREGSPVSYIEALVCGTPIIVGDLPISRELINGENGLVVKQDKEDIANKVIKLLKGKFIVKTNAKKFDWFNIKEKYLGVLK